MGTAERLRISGRCGAPELSKIRPILTPQAVALHAHVGCRRAAVDRLDRLHRWLSSRVESFRIVRRIGDVMRLKPCARNGMQGY
jgi:hypothetical protein